MGTWSLLNGWLPWTLRIAGAVGLGLLLLTSDRRFWTRWLPAALGVAALGIVVVDVLVDVVWRPFPDQIPVNNLVWAWVGVSAVLLAVVRLVRFRWPVPLRVPARLGVAVLAAVAVATGAAVQINSYWGMYPTAHSLYEAIHPRGNVPLPRPKGGDVLVTTPGQSLLDRWQPPANMPSGGSVSQVTIPGTLSHFVAREGYVYLPPAYLVSPRPALPVIVLLAGQPGAPIDWISAMQLVDTLDAFARAHHGLAPVAVVPDDLGSRTANPLCLDSALGNVETYLAKDVPNWIRDHLEVTTDRTGWFIGGFSHGGTCSLQLAVRAPNVYGGFLDISGQREPSVGGRARTIQLTYHGNAAAFARVDPLTILKHTRYPDTVGLLAAGVGDKVYLPQQRDVRAACLAAGMEIAWLEVPGGHTMGLWRDAFRDAVPWLAAHDGITSPATVVRSGTGSEGGH